MNKVMLVGNLGNKPELKKINDTTTVLNMRVATNRKFSRQAEKVEETTWHNVVMFNPAEGFAKAIGKGAKVAVEGRISVRQYEKDGQKHVSTDIIVDNIEALTWGASSEETSSQPTVATEPSTDFPAVD